jgi:hypothetical protein
VCTCTWQGLLQVVALLTCRQVASNDTQPE